MAGISDVPKKKRRGPGRPFKSGQSGNRAGRPKVPDDAREWLRVNRGPLTVEALETTRALLKCNDDNVRARVANDWLNKVLPDVTHVREQLDAFLERAKMTLPQDAFELVLRIAAEVGDEATDAG